MTYQQRLLERKTLTQKTEFADMLPVSTLDFTTTTLPPESVGAGYPTSSTGMFATLSLWLTRSRRVLFILTAVWVINILDLCYTLIESMHSAFVELNPVAAMLIGQSAEALVGYKVILLFISSSILLLYRRHRIAELGCWFLLTVYSYVGVCWWIYYGHKLISLQDPAVNIDPILGCCLPLGN